MPKNPEDYPPDSQDQPVTQVQGHFVPVDSSYKSDEIDFFEIIAILFERKKLILVVAVCTTVLAVVYAFQITPIYRAETLLAPVSHDGSNKVGAMASQFGGLASIAGINLGGGGGGAEEVIATLKSRGLTNEFIKAENLLPVLFDKGYLQSEKRWKNAYKAPTTWVAYELFDRIRKIKIDKKTRLVTLSIDWKDPHLAAIWVNKLVVMVNEKTRAVAINASFKSIEYLQQELEKTSVIEIKQSIYSLIEAQTKTKMMANTQEEYAFRVLDLAVTPEDRVRPKRKLIVIFGFMLGLFLGVVAVFILRLRDKSI